MQLGISGFGICPFYDQTNEINDGSIKIFCDKPLNLNGISIPADVNIKEYFEIEGGVYDISGISNVIEGSQYTTKH